MKYFTAVASLLALMVLCSTASAQCTSCGQAGTVSTDVATISTNDCGCASPCAVSCGRCGTRCCKTRGCQRCGCASNCNAQPWHGSYYGPYTGSCGQPLALVVPPTAQTKTRWSWGVGGTQVVPICNQYQRAGYYPPSPGGVGAGTRFHPTPRWPSSTDQFGVYYIRAPW